MAVVRVTFRLSGSGWASFRAYTPDRPPPCGEGKTAHEAVETAIAAYKALAVANPPAASAADPRPEPVRRSAIAVGEVGGRKGGEGVPSPGGSARSRPRAVSRPAPAASDHPLPTAGRGSPPHGASVARHAAGRVARGGGGGPAGRIRFPLVGPPIARVGPGVRRMVRAVRVLVVDDEPTTADSLGWLLSAAGCEVRVCHSGERALAEAGEFRPDAAFVDLVMRGISGVAVAAGLRALADPPRLLVCLTGATDERVIPLVRAAGFDVHLLKPTDPRDLVLLARTAAPSGDAGGRVG